ncbi:MAG TPA: sigma 54-interacting transcriptional regulator, partial [Polyangiaceae bacterium]|nr:sigma 54-interacting transcriptional regulator [Polyangiaceae bacterium]
GVTFGCPVGSSVIGSATSSQICLQDPTVSRVHAEISVQHDRVVLRDCESTNGTFIEEVRIRDADVREGNRIRVGSTVMRVERSGEMLIAELSANDSFGEMVGRSPAMRAVFSVLERVAPTDATVLIQGETGTGKDLAARAIHENSRRAEGSFVAVDCGAIAETLFESELFGHVRGAFSGAISDRTGVIEEADGGTLFLDEIGELPLGLQRKLLRVLENREIRRVGSNRSKRVDVRLIAATNQPLSAAVNAGYFREDLFFRLAVVMVELPPLRQRRGDIPILARHLLARLSDQPVSLPAEILASLGSRGWPGNVRELRNFLERGLSLGWAGERIPADPKPISTALDDLVPTHMPLKEARVAWMEQFDEVYLRALLRKTGGNVSAAAREAGVGRRFLQRTMKRIGWSDKTQSGKED